MMFLISKKIKKSPLEKKNSKIKNKNENYRKESGWVLWSYEWSGTKQHDPYGEGDVPSKWRRCTLQVCTLQPKSLQVVSVGKLLTILNKWKHNFKDLVRGTVFELPWISDTQNCVCVCVCVFCVCCVSHFHLLGGTWMGFPPPPSPTQSWKCRWMGWFMIIFWKWILECNTLQNSSHNCGWLIFPLNFCCFCDPHVCPNFFVTNVGRRSLRTFLHGRKRSKENCLDMQKQLFYFAMQNAWFVFHFERRG